MKLTISVLLLAALAAAQLTGKPQSPGKRAPRLSFVESKDAAGITDTDMFDQQKYVEASQSDRATAQSRRALHEAALTREFMDGFSQTKECDGIIFMGKGDQKPDFTLLIIVDSHDTPGQRPVWVPVLRDMRQDKLNSLGDEDSAKQAARSICLAVWKAEDHL